MNCKNVLELPGNLRQKFQFEGICKLCKDKFSLCCKKSDLSDQAATNGSSP